MIERKNQPAPLEVIEQPSAPKQAEALPAPATATEMYLAAILVKLDKIEAQIKPPVLTSGYAEWFKTGDDTLWVNTARTEPVEVELKEPVEQPKAGKRKK